MKSRRGIAIVLLVCVMVLAFVSVGGMAAETGKLVIWSATSAEMTDDLVAAFKALYPGIDVQYITAGSGELLTRLSAEQPNPSGDILLGIAQEAFEGNYDLFTPYTVAKDEIPPLLKDTNPEPRYYGMSMPIQAFIVNTDLLKPWEYPQCWKDLALDIYAGKIIMANPSMSGSAYSQVYQMNELYGFDFLKAVVPNVTFVTSSSLVPESVARGEYAIGVTGDYNGAEKIAEGAPVVVTYPCEGTGARFDASGIIAGSTNLHNAQLFMDWIVTKDALTIVFEAQSRRTVNPDVPTPEGLPPLSQVRLIPYDSIRAAEVREDLTLQVVDLIQ